MDVKKVLSDNNIDPVETMDQFFLNSDDILNREIDLAGLESSDTVLEIGAGPGNLTTQAIDGTLLTVYYTVGEEVSMITINGEGIELLESNNYVATLNGGFVTPPALTLYIVIPEPLTLSLLGLGSFMLRRRRGRIWGN